MKKLMIVGALMLAGCADPVKDAERELEIVESANASNAEVCAAKRKVAEAYLKAQQQERYKAAKLNADVACMNAQLDPAGSPLA